MRATDKNDRTFANDDRSSGQGDDSAGDVPGVIPYDRAELTAIRSFEKTARGRTVYR